MRSKAKITADSPVIDSRDSDETSEKSSLRGLTVSSVDADNPEARLRLLLEVIRSISMGVVIMDADFRVTSANEAYCRMAHMTEEAMIGNRPPFEDLIKETPEIYADAWRSLYHTGSWDGEFWGQAADGERVALNLAITSIHDENGSLSQYAAIVNDVTQRKLDEERIRYQANFDALTGLPNRSLFIDRLHQSLLAMARANNKLGLMFIDLDGFKLVNDTLGHDKGDELLREAAERIAACTRTGDTVARLGGDEFTVIMPNLHRNHDAPVVAQRILASLNKPFLLGGTESFVSGSIGITLYPDDAADANDLLKNADAAMYRAKDNGKANYQFYTVDMNAEVTERLRVKNGLVKALERGELELFYQPKMTLENGKIEGVEALMRWNSADLGMVPPARFIPVMEETGQVVEVGEWAIRTACLQQREWRDAGLPNVRIAVNLSARQLREMSFVSVLEKVLNETGVEPTNLEVEITESMLMSDTENAVAALQNLHEMGVHLAMDDFGTGYSSLSYLRRFPIDTIKIDRSFVSDITTSPDDAEIIRTIINMGRTLGRKIVAEGVETQEQLSILREYECDQIQGYFLSPPLPAAKLTGFLREQNA